ncbi:glutathione S-transferase family protein [Leptospira sp. GIMC2001]|uniref:glutathione S-transferase family protein n=1 Tax=Leptospira sp. GIMC2001 TaxID=1513297 RepID=UPI002349DA98|nr:glutathione S-transferase family protein [Leptospira sp. GIMC2001]WCL47649.1 glutathione S-transferase family protein [Leptospira sp. GIMC2001]
MKIYGSYTSPFVRRIRYLCLELNIPFELIDTMIESGQTELRTKSPIWKVPCIEVDGIIIWDSHVIMEYLFEKNGAGNFRIPNQEEKWMEYNRVNAIDGGLESAINVFYLNRDGVKTDTSAYMQKQLGRLVSALEWIKPQLVDNYFTKNQKLGLSELALYTALDWMRFRKMYAVDEDKILSEFLKFHSNNPYLVKTEIPG